MTATVPKQEGFAHIVQEAFVVQANSVEEAALRAYLSIHEQDPETYIFRVRSPDGILHYVDLRQLAEAGIINLDYA